MSSLSNTLINIRSMNGLVDIQANSGTFDEIDCNTLNVNLSATAPTVSSLSNDNNVATTAWVTNHAGGAYVTLNTAQTISGEKTFSNPNTYINNTLTADTITAVGDLTLNPVGTITCNGKTIDMTGGEIHKCPLIHSQNNNNIVVEGLGTGDVILKTNGIDRVTVADSGITTFSTLPECSVVPTTGNQLVNKTFTDATFVALTGAQTVAGIKTFSSLPECSTSASTGNQLTNKTYVDGAISGGSFVTTNTTQTITGAKTFSTNTLTASAGITVKNGASSQTATLTQNATTLDVIGVGDISIKPTNDFNVVTGTGKNITVSTPSTSILQSTQTYTTGVSNASSYISLDSPTTYISGLSSQPALIISGGFGTIYGLKFTRGGTALAAINRINCSSTNDTFYLEVNSGTQLTITNTAVSISTNFLINQTTYPSTDTTQLGYTIQKTFATTVLSDTTGTFSVVGTGQALGTNKGVYLITCGFELTNSGSDTVNNKALCLSLSSGSGTPVNSYGAWEYYEEINDSMGGAGTRYIGSLTGVYTKTTTTAETLYLNGYANTTGSQTISARGDCSITRIG